MTLEIAQDEVRQKGRLEPEDSDASICRFTRSQVCTPSVNYMYSSSFDDIFPLHGIFPVSLCASWHRLVCSEE